MPNRSLFAVVFEVKPHPAYKDDYLRIAAGLRPALTKVPGFLENERFRSCSRDGYLLSLSLWDNEKALVQWRTLEQHHAAQVRGREGVLDDYRIRVGEVTRVAGRFADRHIGWMRQDQTQVGQVTALTIVDGILPRDCALNQLIDAARPQVLDHDVFEHFNTGERSAVLAGWHTQQEADDFAELAIRGSDAGANIYAIRVIRDYSLKDRREAPQYYPTNR
ncbi:antibiotic biosynthesis monooxygenase family protein [Dyella choica]|uniref:Antibiotic biosynthesis monooxygenase n=1 Tax=Dyella choica TaxID=1927959 RepID=A0A3S0R5I6_9GAMM|nr:antibiotic biosynthesis monooxygenase [Dyella choica]RUL78341.1 antibiotic biosynthesis monooxygenase [Dyella choica]